MKSAAFICLCLALVGAAGCAASERPRSIREQAAQEATAIVESAQATALVKQAQATATALIAGDSRPMPTREMAAATPAPSPTRTLVAYAPPTPAPEQGAPAAHGPEPEEPAQVIGAGMAADGDYIIIQFKAPPQVARSWMQGNVYAIDEATGVRYAEIPVMPVVGPLIGRPKEPGQVGYVMLINAPQRLEPGSMLTVVLGDLRQEHVVIQ